MFRTTSLALVLVLSASTLAADKKDDSLARIRERGVLRWGGDKSGGGPYIVEVGKDQLSGFEVELAEYLARELGVHAQFEQGPWDKLLDRANRGDVDVVLNGYEWTADREEVCASTIPYYIFRLQLMARAKDESIRSWDDLRAGPGKKKKTVGVLGGSSAEKYVREKFGDDVELKSYDGVTNVLDLVEKAQELDATVQDVPIVIYYASQFPGLRSVDRPVEPGDKPGYYVLYVPLKDDSLREALNQAIKKGIDDGTLRRIYEKYHLWNDEQTKLGEIAKGSWPPESVETRPGIWDFMLTLLEAAWMTVQLACISMPLAMMVGLLVAVGRLYGPAWLSLPLTAYVEFLRGTPLLLQLFFIYYLLPSAAGIAVTSYWSGIIGLAINYSAYEAENYRAGLLAIPKGQMEAALALGMSRWTALRRIIIPQAVRIVIPPVTNDFIALFKDTSVCSVIGVTDLTNRYNQLYNDHHSLVLQLCLMTAVLYLLMSIPLSLIARRLEKKFPRVMV